MRPLQVGRHRHHAGAVNSSLIIFSEGWPFRPVFFRPAGPRPEENSEPVCSIISVRKFRPSQRPSFSEFIVNNYRNASQDIVSAISCFLCLLCPFLCPFFLLCLSLKPLHTLSLLSRNLRSAFAHSSRDSRSTFARSSRDSRSTFAHSSRDSRSAFAHSSRDSRSTFAQSLHILRATFAHPLRILSAFSPYKKNN